MKNITNTYKLFLIISLAIILVISIAGCSKNAQKEELHVNIIAPASDVNIKENESVYFQAEATGGEPPYKYKWHFGTAFPDYFKKEVGEIVFKFEGAYQVMLTVTDRIGRQANDSMLVVVESGQLK